MAGRIPYPALIHLHPRHGITQALVILIDMLNSILGLVAGSSKMTQADWYVDWVNGNDNNSGKTPATALKTVMGGVVAKWGTRSPSLGQPTTIHILSSQPLGAEAVALRPLCNGFTFDIIGVPAVLAASVVLSGVVAKNRATGVKLQVNIGGNYPQGTIVKNITTGTKALVESMVGNVATMCQPIQSPYFNGEDDTWANGNTVQVLAAPPVLNLHEMQLIDDGFDLSFNSSYLQYLTIPDPSGFGATIATVSGIALIVSDCMLLSTTLVPAFAGFVALVDCIAPTGTTVTISSNGYAVGGSYSWLDFANGGSSSGTSVVDGDCYVTNLFGNATLGRVYSASRVHTDDHEPGAIFWLNPSVAIYGLCVLWGPGTVRLSASGKMIKSSGSSWAATLLNTGPLWIDGVASGSTFNRATGVWSAAPVAITPAALDTAPGGAIFNPTSGSSGYFTS